MAPRRGLPNVPKKGDESRMAEVIKPYEGSNEGKKQQVSQMFDNVSSNYDQLNRVITFGMDLKWRKNVFKIVEAKQPENILDIATGTADMPILFAQGKAKEIVGIDISKGMLDVGREKVEKAGLNGRIHLELGDAENLRFADNSFDVVTVSYGIRNFEDLKLGLSEILRVLRPGGVFVILETSVPSGFPMKQGYMVYTRGIMPIIGKLFSKDKKAYSYLSKSAVHFPYGEKLKAILEEVGFRQVSVLPQAQGVSTIYRSEK
jgi:demethylmenaquinone methyltransferase/2-methoxy-6-polyprenyl-1,4-benzoquinol methylase